MAKTNDAAKAQREELIRCIKRITGLELKRCATATAGLSVSNKDMRANMFAHMLCNQGNFQIIAWILENWKEFEAGEYIPEEFQDFADPVSVGYGCGTAPRFVLAFNSSTKSKVDRHQSKDAAKTGRKQNFIAWTQAWRMEKTQSLWVGTSRSVKNGVAATKIKSPFNQMEYGCMEDYSMDANCASEIRQFHENNMEDVADEIQIAIDSQKRLAGLLAEGGLTVAKKLSSTKDFAAAANAALKRLRAKKAADAAKEAEVKPEVVKPAVQVGKPKTGKAGKAAKAA